MIELPRLSCLIAKSHGKKICIRQLSFLCSTQTLAQIDDLIADTECYQPLRGFRVHGDENAVPSLAGGKTLHTRNKSSPALYTLATMGAPKPTAKRTAFGDVSNTVHANRPVRDDAASAAKVALEVKQNNVELQPEQKAALPLLKPPHRPASITVSIKSIINNAANISLATKSATDTNQQGATTANTRKALTKKNTTVFKDYSTVLQTTQELPNLVDAHAPVLGDINPQAPLQKAPKVRGETRQKSLPKVQNTPYPIVVQQDTVPAASKVSETTKIEVASETLEEKVGKEKNFEQKANKPVKKPIHILEDESPVIPTSQAGSVPEEVGAPVALPAARKESISKAVLQTLSEPEEYWDEEDEEEENYDEDGYVTARSFRSRGENITGNATTTLVPRVNVKTRKEIAAAKELVESARTIEDIEDDYWDTSMVVEYNDEIFSYMRELEVCLPQHSIGRITNSQIDQDAAQPTLHGLSNRDSVVHAFSTHGLARSGSQSAPASARDSLSLRQLRRSLPILQDCLAWQAAVGRGNCTLCGRKVRRDQLPWGSRHGLHGRRRLYCGRDSQSRTLHAQYAPVRAWLA